jgi:hypothetical protein
MVIYGSSCEVDEVALKQPLEELIARTKPAVVYLKGLQKAGTGFFVSDTGVIAASAHVARGEESLLTLLPAPGESRLGCVARTARNGSTKSK